MLKFKLFDSDVLSLPYINTYFKKLTKINHKSSINFSQLFLF